MTATTALRALAVERLGTFGVSLAAPDAHALTAPSALTADPVGSLPATTDLDAVLTRACAAFDTWRDVPAPVRGQVVRRFGELLRAHKNTLGDLVTLETGKITAEARGEVQEMIDVCDYAVGLSRQLWGRTIASERPGHRLAETWHPLGVVGVISAFNFPVAVWAWNTAVALVCGDAVVWKPSEHASLSALAAGALLQTALDEGGQPSDVSQIVLGDARLGEALVDDARVALVSATGSVRMGRAVGPRVAARFGRSLLELGGNNAAVVAPSAPLDLAIRGIVFAAAGTAGQRCTTLRRLIVHRGLVDEVGARLTRAYRSLRPGDPFAAGTLVGPLLNASSGAAFDAAVAQAVAEGGRVLVGGRRAVVAECGGTFVEPTVIAMPGQTPIVHEETFAPILYLLAYDDLAEAIALNNAVIQGLSSAIFTRDQAEAERFLSASGADTGIANVNIGTSGAEIGGAFGGEKATGGGRESGSDSWRAYMRRATNTINYSDELPLAQGVSFG
jgi:aldehyde dehydrogenase (NAD+)